MRHGLKFALLLPLCLWAHGASAMTTLTYNWSNINCGLVDLDGTRTTLTCPSADLSFSAMAQPGQSVFLTATLNYAYHDDGLPLAERGYFQLDPYGLTGQLVDHEAGGLTFVTNGCSGFRLCPQPPHYIDSSNLPFKIVFGDNDQPDDLSGQSVFTVTAGIASDWFGGAPRTAFIRVANVTTYSGVAPVPEPGTYALMLAGLALMGVAAQRRGRC